MGIPRRSAGQSTLDMKTLIILFIAAAFAEPEADPEADPYLYYGNLGYTGYNYPLTYGHHFVPVVKAAEKVEGEEAEAKAVVPALTYSPYTYPYTTYGSVYGASPYRYTYGAYANHPYSATYGAYANYPYSAYYHNYVPTVATKKVKREAEPEADPEAYYTYGAYGGHHYPYSYGRTYGNYGYAAYRPYSYYGGYNRYFHHG